MKRSRVSAALLSIALLGTGSDPVTRFRAKSLRFRQGESARTERLKTKLREGLTLAAQGRYGPARDVFAAVAQAAAREGLPMVEGRARGDVGACQFALLQYRPALASFRAARGLAQLAGDHNQIAILDTNIASLYSEMGELDSAAAWIQSSLQRLTGQDRHDHLPQLQIQLAFLRGRQHRMDEAIPLFRQGLEAADRLGDLKLQAAGWTRWGDACLLNHDPDCAETAQMEAFRIRKLHHLPLESSYHCLGNLRLQQGNLGPAATLLDRAAALASPQDMTRWEIYRLRGTVRLRQGRLVEALGDLRIAVRLARELRWTAPAADAARIGEENWFEAAYDGFIDAGNRLYLRNHDPALLRETFLAAEENRAQSLRSLLAGEASTPELAPEYWEILARLQRAEALALDRRDAASREAAENLRGDLIRAEAASGVPPAQPTGGLVERAQARLAPDAVLLDFTLSDSGSWLWALDRAGLTLCQLPSRTAIEEESRQTTVAIQRNAANRVRLSANLYQTLFGALPPRLRAKPRWLLGLDQALFEVPVAALVERLESRPVYVAENHATVMVPSASAWLEAPRPGVTDSRPGLMVGVGDPIYNLADARLAARPQPSQAAASPLDLWAATSLAPAELPLPRLVGSGAELDACAAAWRGPHALLEGPAATRDGLRAQLSRRPAVLHFATHFLRSATSSSEALIALSLTRRGEAELVGSLEIAHWNAPVDLVVLSGCHSAEGLALPGAGLLGLTRAWLAARARAVVATRWPTPDDSGPLFAAFYQNLSAQKNTDPALSLASAQRILIRAPGWRSEPRYWATYFVVGSE